MSLNDYLSFAASAAEALERAVARDQQAVELVATPEAERDWAVQRHQRREAGRHTRRVWTRQDQRWHVVHAEGGVVPQRRADRLRERVREVEPKLFGAALSAAAGSPTLDRKLGELHDCLTAIIEGRQDDGQLGGLIYELAALADGQSGGPESVPTKKAEKPVSRRERKAKWLAQAMLLVRDHPEWSDAEIARHVGVNRSQLSRSKEYRQAAALAQGDRKALTKGHLRVDDTGRHDVEAVWDDDPAEQDWDD